MKILQKNCSLLTNIVAIAIVVASAPTERADAANVTWSGLGPDQNWSDAANWSGGVPSGNAVIFPAALFPASTNTQGAINNIVDANVTITGLTYANTNNASGTNEYYTTLIASNVTLTVNGTVTVGANNMTTVAGMAGTNCTFVVSNTAGNFNVEGNSATAQTVTFTLADATNIIEVGTLSIAQTGGNNGRQAILNLGNSTNLIYANSISLGTGKGQGTVQFAGPDGGLTIRNASGTNRATLLLGNGTSGSGAGNGKLLMAGHPANVLAGTVTLGELGNDSGNQQGTVTIDNGIFDATSILMGVIPSSGSLSTGTANSSSFTVGGDPNNIATLIVNSPSGPGGGSLIVSDNANASHTSSGTLNIDTNGSALVYCSITKAQAANNTATVSINGGKLTMESVTNLVGTPSAPIDAVNLTSATLVLAVTGNSTNIVASSLSILDAGSTVNVTALPLLTGYPSQFPVAAFSSLPNGGTLNLGTLPGTFMGYISNDNVSTIWLVVTNGPSTAKLDEWGGGMNNQWDTMSLNWTNAGIAVKYAENDLVVFDDLAQAGTVNLTSAHTPLDTTVTNNVLNYTFTGAGSIGGATGLKKEGSASLTLSETGGDNFSGGITVDGGTVILDDANSAISGGLAINSGTVQIGNNDANGALPGGTVLDDGVLVFDLTGSATVAGAVSGTGALVQNGSGTVTLTGTNTYLGNTMANSGTLALSGSGSIPGSAAVQVNNATFDVSGASQAATLNGLNLTNATLNVAPNANASANIVCSSLAFGGATNKINITSLPVIASYPVTFTVIQSAVAASGPFNVGLGTPLPGGALGYVSQSADQTAILLNVTNGTVGVRPQVVWTGADLPNSDTNWSDRLNWELPGAPTSADNVLFNGSGSQTSSELSTAGGGASALALGLVNNIVDANFAISTLTFTNAGSFHNTWINSGVTLSITNTLTVGSGSLDFGAATTESVAIAGTNGTLQVNNTNGTLYVGLGSTSSGNHQATLDMSALGAFEATVSRFAIGVGSSSGGFGEARESGTVYLAQTNTITASLAVSGTETSGTSSSAASIDVGDNDGNGGGASFLYLGQTNAFFADAVCVGRQKQAATIAFNTAFANPSAYIRSQNRVSPASIWSVGDGVGNTGTTAPTGVVDFSGGTVDALVGTMYIGRAADSTAGTGNSTGTLTLNGGVFNVGTMYIGLEPTNNASKQAIGTVNVVSNSTSGAAQSLIVSGSLNMGFNAGAASSVASSTLNLTNGTVRAYAIAPGTNANATSININVAGGTLVVTNPVGSAAAPLGTLTLAPLGTADNTATVLSLPVRANSSGITVTTLQIDGMGTTTNIINVESVGPVGATPVELSLIKYGALSLLSGGVTNIGLGTLPAGYAGYLTNDTDNNVIGVVLTSALHPQPVFSADSVQTGTNFVASGVNGFANVPYTVLASTNATLPLASWTSLGTGIFGPTGNFSIAAPVTAATPQQFFILRVVP